MAQRASLAFVALRRELSTAALELEGGRVDEEAAEATMVAMGRLARPLKRALLAARILAILTRCPGSTGNSIARRVSGDRALLFRTLRELANLNLVREENRAGSGRRWYVLSTAPRPRAKLSAL